MHMYGMTVNGTVYSILIVYGSEKNKEARYIHV